MSEDFETILDWEQWRLHEMMTKKTNNNNNSSGGYEKAGYTKQYGGHAYEHYYKPRSHQKDGDDD